MAGLNFADIFETVVDTVPTATALVVRSSAGDEMRLTFAELDKEPTCDENAPAASQLCTYPEGVCECDWGGSPNGFIWSCDTPEPGCPLPRPRVGSACTGDVDCDYVNCGYDQACMNGLWVGNADGCD